MCNYLEGEGIVIKKAGKLLLMSVLHQISLGYNESMMANGHILIAKLKLNACLFVVF